ncbi:MAG: ABC transporter permease [Candidatus Eisenbacteria bacterium RBG_19FT_COMBO_70_11]|nr:MAG: ABC transporter permease [Candidatus Eisenbacteria bacterium RBG_19FT_COMBO_70_11]
MRSGSLERIGVMVRKEFLQVFRDPRMSRVIFVAPIIQLVVFGYAVSTDIRNTRTYVVDHDRSVTSRALIDAFTASGYFRLVGRSDRAADLVGALDGGKAILGIEIPPRLAADIASGRGATVQLLFDGTNSNTATVASGYAERIVQSFGARLAGGSAAPAVDLRPRAWYNPDLSSRDYNVPAVVGSLMLLVSLLLTALAVVREREIGTLEQLMVSPLTARELIAGKTIPFAIIGLFDLALVTTVALLWFRVPFNGNLLLLVLGSVFYLLSGLGIGLLISTVSSTQQEAFLANFLVFMPAILLSGFVFPVSSMPALFQWITLLNPVRHYLVIVRGLFLKGVGLPALWPEFVWLLVLGVALLGFASTRFHKTVS